MFSMFNSSNELVEDPLAIERERSMINCWTSEEKKIFSEKFAAFGKDFQKIASFLDLKKSGKKRNHKENVNSQKKLVEAPASAHDTTANRRTRLGRLLLWRKSDESDRVAVDALIDMCDSLSLEAVSSFGEDFRMIARHVGTKSKGQCKKFFIKDLVTNNDKLGTKMNDEQPSYAAKSSRDKSKPLEARNLSVDFKEAAICNNKSGTKTNNEQPSSATNSSHCKSNLWKPGISRLA
ncbi:hypothetical protein JHK82_047813 [Glycine max]|nr:hypothetical protein JHK82_047813 [Glycine max]